MSNNAMPDSDLEGRAGGGLPKNIFGFGLEIRGDPGPPGPSPGSAT